MLDRNRIELVNRSSFEFEMKGNGFVLPFEKYGSKQYASFSQLQDLMNSRGSRFMLENWIKISGEKEEVAKLMEDLFFNEEPQPEYFYGAKEVKTLLTTGSLDQLEDTLNFAPQGVIDLVKEISINMPLSDLNKIRLISEKTGFNLESMIKVHQEGKKRAEENGRKTTLEKRVRKASTIETEDSQPKKRGRKSTATVEADQNVIDEI